MIQTLQLLVCVAVAALIAIVSLFIDRWKSLKREPVATSDKTPLPSLKIINLKRNRGKPFIKALLCLAFDSSSNPP